MKCTYNVILRSVRANIGGFRNFRKLLKVALLHRCGEIPKVGGYAAILTVHGKTSLTIIIALSELLTEFNAIDRIQ